VMLQSQYSGSPLQVCITSRNGRSVVMTFQQYTVNCHKLCTVKLFGDSKRLSFDDSVTAGN
jgi:hypothetical protein